MAHIGLHHTTIGSQGIDLPVVALSETLAIALMITVDHGVAFCAKAGTELAAMLDDLEVEVVVTVATMGIPLAIETTRALGLDDYAILHKTPKIHLADGESEPVVSITTAGEQRLLFDRERIRVVTGRRVAIIDDVISTGGSITAALRLVRRIGGLPVALGCLLNEGATWRTALGDDADLVRSLGEIPVFDRSADGALSEVWEG